jgi:hypothetical protein
MASGTPLSHSLIFTFAVTSQLHTKKKSVLCDITLHTKERKKCPAKRRIPNNQQCLIFHEKKKRKITLFNFFLNDLARGQP